MQLQNFHDSLKQLGGDDKERATVLGVSERTARNWRIKTPRIIRILAKHPELLSALVADAEACQDCTPPVETAA